MSEVRITIGGREYAVACGEGEEAHVASLGRTINEKLGQLGENLSPSESQNLLFGALFVADALHDARQAAATTQQEFEQQLRELQDSSREGKLAMGQREELKLTIARLEQELDGLQSAQQRHNAEVDDMREELVKRREESEFAVAQQKTLASQLAEITRERDGLLSKIVNKDLLLERANDQMRETNAKLENALALGAAAPIAHSLTNDPDLAPALERFAELLENCANKLEQPASNT